MSLKILNRKLIFWLCPVLYTCNHMKLFDYWKPTYLMVMDILSLLSVLLCSTHLVWILEKNIKNWLDESQKANHLITLVSSLFISWQEIRDFEKLNSFITDEYPYMIHQSVWNYAPDNICCYFYEFFCLCSLQLVSFIEKSNFSVYGVYICKWLKK